MCDFDYEVSHKCQFGVHFEGSYSRPPGVTDCGEPAPYRGWWGDGSDALWLCETHLQEILAKEVCFETA